MNRLKSVTDRVIRDYLEKKPHTVRELEAKTGFVRQTIADSIKRLDCIVLGYIRNGKGAPAKLFGLNKEYPPLTYKRREFRKL